LLCGLTRDPSTCTRVEGRKWSNCFNSEYESSQKMTQ
jgi:hypothetical protein